MQVGPGAVPYAFQNYEPSGIPQPILADQLNANFQALATDAGTLVITITGSVGLLTSQVASTGYKFVGTISANATITWPTNSQGFAVINNATSGGHSIVCGMTGGSFVTIANGAMAFVWSDGVNFNQFAVVG